MTEFLKNWLNAAAAALNAATGVPYTPMSVDARDAFAARETARRDAKEHDPADGSFSGETFSAAREHAHAA
jgi:hypothetical protein